MVSLLRKCCNGCMTMAAIMGEVLTSTNLSQFILPIHNMPFAVIIKSLFVGKIRSPWAMKFFFVVLVWPSSIRGLNQLVRFLLSNHPYPESVIVGAYLVGVNTKFKRNSQVSKTNHLMAARMVSHRWILEPNFFLQAWYSRSVNSKI